MAESAKLRKGDTQVLLREVYGVPGEYRGGISKAIFENHVSNRRVEDPNLLAFVDELQVAGSKPTLIFAISTLGGRQERYAM
ncbi:hypothetical protein C6341_g25721 [Phytophthora cactorum]|nr:hypothetical protein C6341_g25721 [Phytophthora cactorum]